MRHATFWSLIAGLLAVTATAAEPAVEVEEKPEPAQIIVSLQWCVGKPGGKVEDGTLKILSAPRLLVFDGREAQVMIGGQKELPGHSEFVQHGMQFDLAAKLLKKDAVLLKLRYESTALVEDDRADRVTAQGTCIRSSVVVKPGETIRIGEVETEGRTSWLEVTAEVVPPGDVLAMARRAEEEAREANKKARNWARLISSPFVRAKP